MPSNSSSTYVSPTLEQVRAAEIQLDNLQRVIEYDTKEFTVELLANKFAPLKDEEPPDIFVPTYQRRFNWDERRQARFIESVLMGLPIPFLFFADMRDGRLEVVDGLQRLSTCEMFYRNKLVLSGLERLSELDGFLFSDLPKAQQRRFKNRTIRCIVLSQHATDQDRRDLFDRINTGSLIAEPAEVRRGSIPGPLTDLIDRLALNPDFNRLCPTTDQEKREREREELILRYFTLLDGMRAPVPLEKYNDRMRVYMDQWLKTKNNEAALDTGLTESYSKLFIDMLVLVSSCFSNGFAKTTTAKTTPRVRFDAIAVGAALAMLENPSLTTVDISEWVLTDDFTDLTTSSAANVRSRILGRISYVRDRLLGR